MNGVPTLDEICPDRVSCHDEFGIVQVDPIEDSDDFHRLDNADALGVQARNNLLSRSALSHLLLAVLNNLLKPLHGEAFPFCSRDAPVGVLLLASCASEIHLCRRLVSQRLMQTVLIIKLKIVRQGLTSLTRRAIVVNIDLLI